MLILQLLLAHLLGDFVFQSNKLIKEKYKSWKGTLKHALIVAALTFLAMFPYWDKWETWFIIAVLFTLHFSQDVFKVEYDKKMNKKKSQTPYFMDQVGHILLIMILGTIFADALPEFYWSAEFIFWLIGLVFLSFTIDITKYQFSYHNEKKREYIPDYKGMSRRMFIFSLIFGIYLLT